jgi:MSHA pilin protein MshD
MSADRHVLRQRGVTLIETIVLMVMLSVGVIGLVTAMNPLIRASADPMVTKQMVAIAESLLNEIEHQPNTWCDPDDTNAATAQSYAGCATNPQNVLGPTPNTERRDGSGPSGQFFDNVRDYAGFAMDNIADPAGGSVVAGYRAEVAIVEVGATFGIPADAALAITVTACQTTAPSTPCAGRNSIAVAGYRFRYAPRY